MPKYMNASKINRILLTSDNETLLVEPNKVSKDVKLDEKHPVNRALLRDKHIVKQGGEAKKPVAKA